MVIYPKRFYDVRVEKPLPDLLEAAELAQLEEYGQLIARAIENEIGVK